MPRGIPAKGTRAKGGGRKPSGEPRMVRLTVTVTEEQARWLRRFPSRQVSVEVREALWNEMARKEDG